MERVLIYSSDKERELTLDIVRKCVLYYPHMYNISQFAKKVGVAVKTLQRWDREGRLVAHRTLTNRRYYTDEDLARALGLSTPKKVVTDDQSAQNQAPPDA